jgi:thiol-disulfide isomerase/thioredoxin
MVFLHIKNDKEELQANKARIRQLDNHIKNNKDAFILVYMEGCGPCNMTRPEWIKLENALSNKYGKNNNVMIVDIDSEFINKLKHLKHNIMSFPTLIYVSKSGKNIKNYEDSNIKQKDRTLDSFVDWINHELKDKHSDTNSVSTSKHNKTRKNNKHNKNNKRTQMGGKWTLKYKRSINCKRPRGFSQRQYCKYGRK